MATKQLENKKENKKIVKREELIKRLQVKSEEAEKKNLKISLVLGLIAVFWLILTLTTIGKEGTALFGCLAIIFGLVSGYLCVPIFVKARDEKKKQAEQEQKQNEDKDQDKGRDESKTDNKNKNQAESRRVEKEVRIKGEDQSKDVDEEKSTNEEQDEEQLKSKRKIYTQSALLVGLVAVVLVGSIISMIASPIVRNAKCAAFTSVADMTSGERELCKDRVAALEKEQSQTEEEKQAALQQKRDEIFGQLAGQTFNVEKQDFCQSFTGNDYPNNYQKSIRFDDSSHVTIYGCGDSVKTYPIKFVEGDAYKFRFDASDPIEVAKDLSYIIFRDNKYVTTVPMQDSVVSELEKSKAAESASKSTQESTTTLTGKDHDDNDQAGKYTALMNKCLDRLNHHFENTYPLDSDDGYPISYSVTLDSNGTLVEGTMAGHHKTKTTQKVLEYKCVYKNGSAKIQGLD